MTAILALEDGKIFKPRHVMKSRGSTNPFKHANPGVPFMRVMNSLPGKVFRVTDSAIPGVEFQDTYRHNPYRRHGLHNVAR